MKLKKDVQNQCYDGIRTTGSSSVINGTQTVHLDYFKKERPVILSIITRENIIDPIEYASRIVD